MLTPRAVILALLLTIGVPAASARNMVCPVTGDETLEEYSAVHEGRVIYFCCPHCLAEFHRDPARYAAELPPETASDSATPQAPTAEEPDDDAPHPVVAWLTGHWYLWLFGLLLVIGRPFVAARAKNPESVAGQLSRPAVTAALFGIVAVIDVAQDHLLAMRDLIIAYWWVLVVAAGVVIARLKRLQAAVVILVALLAAVLVDRHQVIEHYEGQQQKNLDHAARDRLKDRIHFATFHDFGDPPTPPRPPWDKRLESTYYRGNDERNTRLFNNGNYRTATFHIDVRTQDGRALTYGAAPGDQEVFVRLEVVRAPFTPDFFYAPAITDGIFATTSAVLYPTRETAPKDRMSLTVLEPMQRFEIRWPLGVLGDGTHHGVVYLRQDHEEQGEILGARFHYGLEYHLVIEGGRVAPDSDYWMGPLYRTRKVTLSKLPYSEWFSHEPIPLLPGKHKTADPKILGTSDHEKK